MPINRIFTDEPHLPDAFRDLPAHIRTMPRLGFDCAELRGDWHVLEAARRIMAAPTMAAVVAQAVTEMQMFAKAGSEKHVQHAAEGALERVDQLYAKRLADHEQLWDDWAKKQQERFDQLERELLARFDQSYQKPADCSGKEQ